MTKCGNEPYGYNQPHEFAEWEEHAEAAVVVMTIGPRAGRIYLAERTYRKRRCQKCGEIEQQEIGGVPAPWPDILVQR